jgi:mercuric ion transport protein
LISDEGAKMQTITFQVKDMTCVNCAMRLQGLEDELPGVVLVDASYTKQKMVVKYDETRVSPQQIIFAVRDLGYTAELIEP